MSGSGPDDPATLFARGNALLEAGAAADAVTAFAACARAAPAHAATRYNLGNALRGADRPVEAAEAFLACLARDPGFGPAYLNLADTLRCLGLLTEAEMPAQEALRRIPGEPAALFCLANLRHDQGAFDAAAALYRQGLASAPDHAGAWGSLGNTLRACGDLPAALAAHERAIALAPDDASLRFNRATTLLAAGDFARGWDEYEWRWRRRHARDRGFGPAWDGTPLAGRTILLHAEQGLGDTLQFVRYAPLVAARGGRVLLEVQPPLRRLLGTMRGVAAVYARGDTLPPFDLHCPLLSLPRAFGTRRDTIPSEVPYLNPPEALIAAAQARLPAGPELRVGVVWAGSAHADDAGAQVIDRRRSLPPAALLPLADIPNLRLVSLQRHATGRALPPPALRLEDPMAEVRDMADTAALVAQLDVVVSADTAVAHLAAGIGKPVLLLSRFDACWRWLQGIEDSPWYPGLRLFRQQRPGDWTGPVARAAADLAARAAGCRPAG
ncbi:MAG: tetratricopeptide repeat protein [Rhodospirillales bacterium]|nr:tetratricopeptide repeat protein [Rhodospirillales bacterium]